MDEAEGMRQAPTPLKNCEICHTSPVDHGQNGSNHVLGETQPVTRSRSIIAKRRNTEACNATLVTVQPYPKEIRGTNPAARSSSDEVSRSSQCCAPYFELLRFREEEAGEESEDEAVVVDVVEARLDVEEPERTRRSPTRRRHQCLQAILHTRHGRKGGACSHTGQTPAPIKRSCHHLRRLTAANFAAENLFKYRLTVELSCAVPGPAARPPSEGKNVTERTHVF